MIKKIINKINSTFFKFNPTYKINNNITQIGTIYGGYEIYNQNLERPIILSCGLGEDASFDIDMINKFDAKVIILDPTLLAYLDIQGLLARLLFLKRSPMDEYFK